MDRRAASMRAGVASRTLWPPTNFFSLVLVKRYVDNVTGERPSSASRARCCSTSSASLLSGPDLAVDPGAFPFCEESNQRILGQLAVLVVFMCRTEVLDDPADSVGVSVPTRGQPD